MIQTISLKVTQSSILSIKTYEKGMIAVGNENKKIKNKDIWKHYQNMPILSLLRENYCLPVFHMAKIFIWLNETKNELTILRLDI